MQVVPRRTAAPAPAPYAAAEASFAETKAYLSSREALQMRESNLERELNRRGQELMHKLLQGGNGKYKRDPCGHVKRDPHGDGSRRGNRSRLRTGTTPHPARSVRQMVELLLP